MYEEIMKYFTIDNGLFILISMIGMLGHAIKKFLAGHLRGSVLDYLIFNNPKRTALAVLSTLAATIGVIIGDQMPTQVGAYIMLAFTTGYTADSAVNKDADA